MKLYSKNIFLFFSLLISVGGIAQHSSYNSVYQYEVAVGTRTAYLWIPPNCSYVRGIIIAAENALERNWMESAIIRKAAADENLAMIWLADGRSTNITYEIKPEAATALDSMFYNLAMISGYNELEFASLIFTGHSWNGRMAWNYPVQRPERVIASVPIRTYPMPDTLLFSGIPLLYIVGQTTELPQYSNGRPGDRDFYWPVVRSTALALRNKSENNLIGVAVNPGGCHMDWTDEQSKFLALFIKKACKYRLPGAKPANGKVELKKITASSGWLIDTGCLEPDHFKPAPYSQYKGDPKKAFWFFDEEMAKAAVAFNGNKLPHQKQMATFIQNGEVLPVQRNGYVQLKWSSPGNTSRFTVQGGFLSKYPVGLIDSGKTLGHAPGPIKLYHVMGPAVQINDTTFQLEFDRQNVRNIMIMADQPGDKQYGRATQGGTLSIPAQLTKGASQQIDFPAIPDQKISKHSFMLHASATSGLPVQYFIKSGPAIIKDNQVLFTGIPVKSKYPVKVTVVACQWGSMTEPLYQTAQRVTREFYITNE